MSKKIAAPLRKDRPLPVASWVLYDFANTIFYAVVVTRYLPLQLTELTGKHFYINLGFYPSMIAAAFSQAPATCARAAR